MDRAQTVTAVAELLGPLGEAVTDASWGRVLARSVIPDDTGRLPGSAGYVDNYDPDWAAAEVVAEALQRTMVSEQVLEWTSEGTRMKAAPADLATLEAKLRDRSLVARFRDESIGRLELRGTLPSYAARSGSGSVQLGVVTNRD